MKHVVSLMMMVLYPLLGMAHQVSFGKGTLTVNALTPTAFRVQYQEKELAELPEWIYVSDETAPLKQKTKGDVVIFTTTADVSLIVDVRNQTVTVKNSEGKEVFRATEHTLRSSSVAGLPTYEATMSVVSPSDEHLYGLGQFQDGYTDLRGLSRRLTQVNTQISIPMYMSNKGYGLLWNNYGMTEFNPLNHQVALVKSNQEGEREVVNVTSTHGGRNEVRVRNIFKGQIEIPADGKYSLLLDVGKTMARRHNLRIDGKTVVDHRNLWLPPTTSLMCHLTAGVHTIEAELERDDKPVFYYKEVGDETVLRSPVANAVDYTIFVGTADEIVGAYRQVTGAVPMLPKWALGYIHCRERYHSSDEIIQNARQFRKEQIPLDLIVQDWQWWGKYGWNAMKFDETHYPDPRKLVDDLHAMDVRLMLSVWSKIDKNSEVGRSMLQQGYYIPGTDWVDFFNPDAAAAYWKNFSSKLLKPYGIDAWWQDATEPENDDLKGRKIWNGKYPGELFRNAYPLLVNKTVFEGSRQDAPERRAMILTRCGFPGIQRYGAAMWSGDVGNDFETLRIQISSGLGMQAAGMPWWTYDAGGFFRPGDQYTNKDYIERLLRWVQTSVYLPLMRVHGYMSNTEPWRYGPEAQAIITECIRERYRLLPYIYSNAADVSFKGGTIMRPLIFDFPNDEKALQQETAYMFGRALLVHPVVTAQATEMTTYLPVNNGGWYDYATGAHHEGGRSIRTAVSKSSVPVFVRGGSILPLGADRQSTADRVDENLTIRVYPGADAAFELYDDEGTNYNYEQGKCVRIPLTWKDSKRTLTIGKQNGAFDGMPATRTLTVTLPDGTSQTVAYSGKKVTMEFPRAAGGK